MVGGHEFPPVSTKGSPSKIHAHLWVPCVASKWLRKNGSRWKTVSEPMLVGFKGAKRKQ